MAIGDRQEHTTTIDMVRRTLTSCQLVRKGLTRQKGIDTFDATQKLREVGGYTVIIGTPWSPEDLYATLIRRRQADDESPESEKMRIRIDPSWTVKPDARHKQLPSSQITTIICSLFSAPASPGAAPCVNLCSRFCYVNATSGDLFPRPTPMGSMYRSRRITNPLRTLIQSKTKCLPRL